MSEKLITAESTGWPLDGLNLCHPNTARADELLASSREGGSFYHFRDDPDHWVREGACSWPGQKAAHQRSLHRLEHTRRVEQGETKLLGKHETYLFRGGWLERLFISQRRWADCDGRIEARVYYPRGWEQPAAIWLTSRSDINQGGDFWFELPNLSLLATCDYNHQRRLFELRLLLADYDQKRETARLLTAAGQSISRAWGHQVGISGQTPKVESWGLDDDPLPWDWEDRLRSIRLDYHHLPAIETETALDGVVDCRRLVEAIRAQTETGPIDLNRLARSTDLIG